MQPQRINAFRNSVSVSLLEIGEADARSAQKTPAGTTTTIPPCTVVVCEFAMRTRYCLEPRTSLSVLRRREGSGEKYIPLSISSAFENRRCRYEARAQINRRRIFDTLRINLCAATKYMRRIFSKVLGGGGIIWKKLYTSRSFALLHALSLLRRQRSCNC